MKIQNLSMIPFEDRHTIFNLPLKTKQTRELVKQQILTIAKALYENSQMVGRPLFLSIKKGLYSHDTGENIYEGAPSGNKYHFFSDLKSKSVRVYVSSINVKDKDPSTCESGNVKMCTNADKFNISFIKNSPSLEGPVKVKRLRIRTDINPTLGEYYADKIASECEFYKELSNIQQVCKLYDYAIYKGSHKGESTQKATMYLEKYDGILNQFLEELIKNRLSEEQILEHILPLYKQVLEGLDQIHAQGVVHGDLKFDNVVYKSTSTNFRIGMIDFECAQRLQNLNPKSRGGTGLYLAPEIVNAISKNEDFIQNISPARDMWAAGCMLLSLLQNAEPPISTVTHTYIEVDNLSAAIDEQRERLIQSMQSDSSTETSEEIETHKIHSDIEHVTAVISSNTACMENCIEALEKTNAIYISPIQPENQPYDIDLAKENFEAFQNTFEYSQEELVHIQSLIQGIIRSNPLTSTSKEKIIIQLTILQDSTEKVAEALLGKLRETYKFIGDQSSFKDPLQELIRRLFDPNPDTRISAAEALKLFQIKLPY